VGNQCEAVDPFIRTFGIENAPANYNKMESLPYVSNPPKADCSLLQGASTWHKIVKTVKVEE
jgi:hypothetical protein